MWEPDFSVLGKRQCEDEGREESDPGSTCTVCASTESRDLDEFAAFVDVQLNQNETQGVQTGTGEGVALERDVFGIGKNAHLRDLILRGGPTDTVLHFQSHDCVVTCPPRTLVESRTHPFVVPVTMAHADSPATETGMSKPTVGPDPNWKQFEHAGLMREMGGLDGWRKVFVHKTHQLPKGSSFEN